MTYFRIMEVAVNEDGEMMLKWYGAHPAQGGVQEQWGSISSGDPETIGALVTQALTDNADIYAQRIRNKSK